MTENKRFTYHEQDIDNMILPIIRENGNLVARSVYECYHLLNKLNDENEQLKESVWSWSTSYNRIYEEKEMTLGRLNYIKSTLAYRSNQLTLMEQLIDDLGSEEMKRQMEEILND